MIKKFGLILFWSIVENLGNLSYWAYQAFFHWYILDQNYTVNDYAKYQFLNHIYLVLPAGIVLFMVRYYIKNKENLK